MYVIIIFRSRNDTLAVREVMLSLGIQVSVIDAPRHITTSCGLALKIRGVGGCKVKNLIYSNNVAQKVAGIYEVFDEGLSKRYQKVF